MRPQLHSLPAHPGGGHGQIAAARRPTGALRKLLQSDVPLKEVLPSLYKQHPERYADYTLRQICQEMHDLYARHNVKQLQKRCSAGLTSRAS